MSSQEAQDLSALQKGLDDLAQWENQMAVIDRDVEIFRIRSSRQHYSRRSEIVKSIPKFWYIVFAENDDFADYVSADDLKFFESIENVDVSFKIATADEPLTANDYDHYKDFSISFTFSDSGLVPAQTVTKHFRTILENGEELIFLDPVEVAWPSELSAIDPRRIKSENKGKPLQGKLKKDYRLGMRSFFSWFAWTGEKPGKEFRNGEDFTRLIADDLYLNALKYYILALPSINSGSEDEEEGDSSEGEALDLSDVEEPPKESKKRTVEDGPERAQAKRRV